VNIRAIRIAFSFASVPELQKKAFESCVGATDTSFSAATRSSFGVDKIGIEEKLSGLFLQRLDNMRMTMAGAGDSVTTI
jgi:hypothetical protein